MCAPQASRDSYLLSRNVKSSMEFFISRYVKASIDIDKEFKQIQISCMLSRNC